MRFAGFATKIVAAVVGLAALLAVAWVVVEIDAAGRIHETTAELAPAEAGVVLGTSRWLRGHYPNPYFDNRIAAAAELYASGKVKYLIVSGNQSRGGRAAGGYDEPADMREALIGAGVPADKIYRDYAGFRTLDSVVRANEIFGLDRAVLVSQHFHLARALFIAERRGLDFEGFVAADLPFRLRIKTEAREIFARAWAFVDVMTGKAPRFGGAPVRLGVDAPT